MSKATDPNLWGIHAGKTGDADSLFLTGNCIASCIAGVSSPS